VTNLGDRFERCPKSWIADEAYDESLLFRDFLDYSQTHVLPRVGGWLDQSPTWVDSHDVIKVAVAEVRHASRGQ